MKWVRCRAVLNDVGEAVPQAGTAARASVWRPSQPFRQHSPRHSARNQTASQRTYFDALQQEPQLLTTHNSRAGRRGRPGGHRAGVYEPSWTGTYPRGVQEAWALGLVRPHASAYTGLCPDSDSTLLQHGPVPPLAGRTQCTPVTPVHQLWLNPTPLFHTPQDTRLVL